MRKTFVLALSLCLTVLTFAQESAISVNPETQNAKPKKSILRSGFSIKLGVYNPSSDFAKPEINTSSYKDLVYAGPNFQLGSQFYIGPSIAQNKLRFGLDVSWLDLSWALGKNDEIQNYDQTSQFFEFSGFGLGPLVSYNPVDKLVIDTYVKAVPSFFLIYNGVDYTDPQASSITLSHPYDNSYSENALASGLGVKGLLGFAVRYKFIQTGFEYQWGKTQFYYATTREYTSSIAQNAYELAGGDQSGTEKDSYGNKFERYTGNYRFFVGFRF